jgi:hypothetical protein
MVVTVNSVDERKKTGGYWFSQYVLAYRDTVDLNPDCWTASDPLSRRYRLLLDSFGYDDPWLRTFPREVHVNATPVASTVGGRTTGAIVDTAMANALLSYQFCVMQALQADNESSDVIDDKAGLHGREVRRSKGMSDQVRR